MPQLIIGLCDRSRWLRCTPTSRIAPALVAYIISLTIRPPSEMLAPPRQVIWLCVPSEFALNLPSRQAHSKQAPFCARRGREGTYNHTRGVCQALLSEFIRSTDANANDADSTGATPMHVAATHANAKVAPQRHMLVVAQTVYSNYRVRVVSVLDGVALGWG
jgi:hypothetical protein